MRRLAAIVLTYNSHEDLPACLAGLGTQQGVALDVIVVDNASRPESRQQMRRSFFDRFASGVLLAAGATVPASYRAGQGLFVANDRNGGYSAGNNIGARLAAALGCEAILIVNPDVRIEAPDYLQRLSDALFADRCNAVAASAIRNLSGANENPMFEPGFIDELLQPARMIAARVPLLKTGTRAATSKHPGKLSGCCFLVRTGFLQSIGFFDESVFLYCEEAILAAQVTGAGCRSVYVADIEALHAHRPSAKGDPARRQRLWVRSRRYYQRRYLGYGVVKRAALALSQELVVALTWAESRLRGGVR